MLIPLTLQLYSELEDPNLYNRNSQFILFNHGNQLLGAQGLRTEHADQGISRL